MRKAEFIIGLIATIILLAATAVTGWLFLTGMVTGNFAAACMWLGAALLLVGLMHIVPVPDLL